MGRRHGLLTNLVVGIIGAFMGAFIADALDIRYGGFLGSLAISTLGAIVVLAISRLFSGRRRKAAGLASNDIKLCRAALWGGLFVSGLASAPDCRLLPLPGKEDGNE